MATGFTDNIWKNVLDDVNWRLDQVGAPSTFSGYETKRVETVDPGVWQYFADFVVSFGQRVAKPGATVLVNRLWANQVLIYDRNARFASPAVVPTPTPPSFPLSRTVIEPPPSAPPSPVPGDAPGLSGFTFFDGSEDQGEVFRGMHYRGLMVGRFLNFNLTDYGNRIPAIMAELIDTEANDPDNNIGGTLYYKYAATAIIHELHPEADANYRAYYRASAAGTNMNVDKARLSTKTQSYEVTLKSLDYNGGDTPSADFLRDLQMVFIPSLNYAVGSFWDGATGLKLLHDLATGNTLASFPGYSTDENLTTEFTPWQGCVAFRVTEGGFTHNLVFGATDVAYTNYPIGILVVKAGLLEFGWGVTENTLEPTKCITVGKERSGSTDLYLTLGTKVERLQVFPPGSAGYELTLLVERDDFYVASGGDVLQQAWFDHVRNRLIVLSTNGGVAKLRALDTDGAVVWTSATFPPPNAKTLRARTQEAYSNLSGGSLIISRDATATTVTFVDLVTGDVDAVTVPDNGTITNTLGLNWDSGTNVLYSGSNKYVAIGVIPEPDSDPNRYTAAEIMRAYATFAGYDDANVVTVGMDDLYIDGYVASGAATLSGLSNGIGTLYGFNWSEQANVITFKNNYTGGALDVDMVVDAAKLAKLTNSSDDHFAVSRASDQEFPAVLSLTYFDGRNSYKQGYQIVRRNGEPMPTMGSDQRSDMSLPITLDGDYALELLYGTMYRVWATKLSYTIRLPAEYTVVDAGDAIEFTADGMVYRAVVTRNRINVDNTATLTLNETTDNNYPIQVPTQPAVQVPDKIPQPVRTVVLDIPDTNPAQTGSGTLNLHVLMGAYEPGKFRGAAFDITPSYDPTGWVTRAAIGVDQEAFIGQLSETLGYWDEPFETDTYNAIVLDLGTIPTYRLTNATEADLDAGLNLLAIGEGSEVELVQFAVAEDIGGGLYRLSQLRRGRYGTEVFQTERPIGTTVSFLDNAQIVTYEYLEYEHDTQFLYRSYSPNQPKWQVDDYTIIPQGNSRKPYAPINIEAVREADGDIKITWTRRTRYTNSPPSDFNMPDLLDESQELYHVQIFEPIGVDFRTIEVVSEEAIYALAEQLVDGRSGSETELALTVAQSSVFTVGDGLLMPVVIPIYDEGTARIRARFGLGGEMAANVVLEVTPTVFLSVAFDGGGEMTVNAIPTPVRLAAAFDGGGSLEVFVGITQPVAFTSSLGGEMVVNVENSVVTNGLTKLRRTSDQALATNAYTDISWQAVDIDDLAAFDAGTPTLFTVPTGMNLMRVNVQGSVSGGAVFTLLVNNTTGVVAAGDMRTLVNEAMHTVNTGWIAVTPGDEYRLQVFGSGSGRTFGTTFPGPASMTIEWANAYTSLHA